MKLTWIYGNSSQVGIPIDQSHFGHSARTIGVDRFTKSDLGSHQKTNDVFIFWIILLVVITPDVQGLKFRPGLRDFDGLVNHDCYTQIVQWIERNISKLIIQILNGVIWFSCTRGYNELEHVFKNWSIHK